MEDYSVSIGMQYSLFITAFICAIGGGFFLFASLFVDEDRLVRLIMHKLSFSLLSILRQ